MARALKVYRTPTGFHDAYVAAPSKKAALEAWGSDKDLFARGAAEIVSDPALTAEPLARPGEVIRRLRGTEAEQIAALPPDPPTKAAKPPLGKPAKRRPPRPRRDKLEQAEAALAAADERHAAARRAIAEQEAALARERHKLDEAHERERAKLEQARADAASAYADAVERWES